MKKLAWQVGKALEEWGIQVQAWADPEKTTRDADETVKRVCMQNIGRVKLQVQQGVLSEEQGEKQTNSYLDSYNQISNRLWQNGLSGRT